MMRSKNDVHWEVRNIRVIDKDQVIYLSDIPGVNRKNALSNFVRMIRSFIYETEFRRCEVVKRENRKLGLAKININGKFDLDEISFSRKFFGLPISKFYRVYDFDFVTIVPSKVIAGNFSGDI